jgi:hypothetical protein
MMLIGPLIGGLLQRRHKSNKMGLITTLVFAWKMFGRIRALVPAFFARRRRKREGDARPSAT